ncbi:hypothetical protein [Mucilaginibacter lacusdianchii]|uniref:hypothetical protein n=1 Tax=Mucilaginibacter lacusdianchii TaxID=2684211 RepID=UPI00131EB5F3|nr:hypothetical protein [Mucilaginibacter sp. JXJ CY 39]
MWRDTGLRYIPEGFAKVSFLFTIANYFKELLAFRNLHFLAAKVINNWAFLTSKPFDDLAIIDVLNCESAAKIDVKIINPTK